MILETSCYLISDISSATCVLLELDSHYSYLNTRRNVMPPSLDILELVVAFVLYQMQWIYHHDSIFFS
jgi:hypothetical protein